ncbi:MAG: SPOR domain-containing protein [Pseudomonadota bacterium]
MKTLLLGFMAGTLIGALLMYRYGSGGESTAAPLAQADCSPSAQGSAATSPPIKDAKEFDFYGALERAPMTTAEVGESGAAPASGNANKSAAAEAEEATPAYLQVASFKSEDEAEALKARIAMAGLAVNVVATDIPGQGRHFRVRVGPFSGQDALAAAKNQLRHGGVDIAQVFVVR